jgi:proline iminopeptidase
MIRTRVLMLLGLLLVAGAGCGSSVREPREGYVNVPGGRVWYRIVGSGRATPLLLLHGGPGAPSYYLQRLEALADERPVILYDQLGCGRSDRPTDQSLWRTERFVEELARVRSDLGLRRTHILGHSWGSMLAVDYMLTSPQGVVSLVLAGPALSIPRYLEDVQKLREALPPETQSILAKHEAARTTDSPEYQQAALVFYRRHLSRLDPWPSEMEKTMEGLGTQVYNTMWGPSEFYATGLLKDYDRTPRLGELRLPVLLTAGRYDETTADRAAWYQTMIPGSRLEIFEQSAHMTMLDESDRYVDSIRRFLREVDQRK